MRLVRHFLFGGCPYGEAGPALYLCTQGDGDNKMRVRFRASSRTPYAAASSNPGEKVGLNISPLHLEH
jgi:hypothetical protein